MCSEALLALEPKPKYLTFSRKYNLMSYALGVRKAVIIVYSY